MTLYQPQSERFLKLVGAPPAMRKLARIAQKVGTNGVKLLKDLQSDCCNAVNQVVPRTERKI